MSRTDRVNGSPGLLDDLAARYLAALVAGDRDLAASSVRNGLEAGLGATPLLLDVLAPAQRELGHLWSEGKVSIAQEHRATEITREEIEQVRLARRQPRRAGATAVVCAAPSEVHSLPARFFAALLDSQGWESEFLGEAPPGHELVAYVARRRPRLVALSVTLPANLGGVEPLCQGLRCLAPRPHLLVGGAAVVGLTAEALGVDSVAVDAAAGLREAAGLVAPPPLPDLPTYLATVGRRIRSGRRAAGLSQASLAERSGLTRPYLGAVERGRQNITLEAALKIAGALGLSLIDLLAEEAS